MRHARKEQCRSGASRVTKIVESTLAVMGLDSISQDDASGLWKREVRSTSGNIPAFKIGRGISQGLQLANTGISQDMIYLSRSDQIIVMNTCMGIIVKYPQSFHTANIPAERIFYIPHQLPMCCGPA